MITLYHGSNQEIGEIDLQLGLPDKDFGRGFYLTHLRKQAERMALSKCQRMMGKPTVTVYEYDEEEARRQKLRIKVFDKPTEAWAQFVDNNRHASRTGFTHKYDIVIGPIANDRVGVQLWKYENRSIDLPTLVHNLRNMRGITFQYFFGTERAIKILKRL